VPTSAQAPDVEGGLTAAFDRAEEGQRLAHSESAMLLVLG
jgi:hypothetical protein